MYSESAESSSCLPSVPVPGTGQPLSLPSLPVGRASGCQGDLGVGVGEYLSRLLPSWGGVSNRTHNLSGLGQES